MPKEVKTYDERLAQTCASFMTQSIVLMAGNAGGYEAAKDKIERVRRCFDTMAEEFKWPAFPIDRFYATLAEIKGGQG